MNNSLIKLNKLEWKQHTELSPMSWHRARELEVDGWSLPTRKQLEIIFNILYDENEKLVYGFLLNDYWTSELYNYNNLYVWSFDFQSGETKIKIKQEKLYVRLCKPRNFRMC